MQVEAALREELIETVKTEAAMKGIALPPDEPGICKAPVPIDSLVAVSILTVVEAIIGFTLPDSVVRTGGYASVDAALADLVPRIEAKWKKKNGVSP
ncbi:hypothetical protein EOD23_01945 [Mesorhizobium sp. USDA-HM6]|nr:hypothetical protein EOD23_01945 [Mesorhizobium sp. USDA-HM6]